MRYPPDSQSVAIVLVGRFNPAIFSPAWFARAGIINDVELANAVVQVIHPELTQFKLEHFAIEVQTGRFQIISTVEPFVRMLDDLLTVFGHLRHTPIAKAGINYEVKFRLESFAQRHALGRTLAPIQPWGRFGQRLDTDRGPETVGGLVALVMQESAPPDRQLGWRRVQIEPEPRSPSSGPPNNETGVKMSINDHFEIPEPQAEQGCEPLMKLIQARFDASLVESKRIVTELMEFASTLK